jgi:hypothetical protein
VILYPIITLLVLSPITATATENGSSVYPAGVDTVMPAMNPPANESMVFNYNAYYFANEMDNNLGKSALPEFKLRVYANAWKFMHTWNVHVLGGELQSNVAFPFIYQRLHVPGEGAEQRFSLGNTQLAPLGIGWVTGSNHNLHVNAEFNGFLPDAGYAALQLVNPGQHYYAVGPDASFTYLPGKNEVSSKLMYLVNFADPTTSYHNGNQFTWEFDGMRQVSHRFAIGGNGYWFDQTTNDSQIGQVFADGNRRKTVDLGPELRINLPHGGCAFKYEQDLYVRNSPRGSTLWFQWALPIHIGPGAAK